MSRIDCNIVKTLAKSKRLLLQLLLLMTALVLLPGLHASAQSDSWRRTAKGWEKIESWNYLVTAPVGKLRPLTLGTLIQRTWPATFAAVEISVILLLLHFGSARIATRPEGLSTTPNE